MKEQGKCARAIESYNKAIKLKPDYADAHWNLANTFLLSGDFEQGWPKYSWRQKTSWKNIIYPHHHKEPRWDGSSFEEKKLFVHCEQGLGDTMQFIRYMPLIKARGGTVIFEVWKSLINLLHGVEGIDETVELSINKSMAEFDHYISLMDLPAIFGTNIVTIPSDVP